MTFEAQHSSHCFNQSDTYSVLKNKLIKSVDAEETEGKLLGMVMENRLNQTGISV